MGTDADESPKATSPSAMLGSRVAGTVLLAAAWASLTPWERVAFWTIPFTAFAAGMIWSIRKQGADTWLKRRTVFVAGLAGAVRQMAQEAPLREFDGCYVPPTLFASPWYVRALLVFGLTCLAYVAVRS